MKLPRNIWIALSRITKRWWNRDKAVTFDQIDLEKARDYSCEDADVTFQLSHLLLPKLKEGGFKDLFDQVEMPLVMVFGKNGDERSKN